MTKMHLRFGRFVPAALVAVVFALGCVPAGAGDGTDEASADRPSKAELRQRLTRIQYAVTQEDSTEPPFHNEYWDNHAPGIYVDVVSGEPLFSSLDKFESGTGWPSFTRPIDPEAVATRTDHKLLVPRTEVRSAKADSHLGHIFEDGPKPTGLRYCINSAALRFVPVDELEEEGYGGYLTQFDEAGEGEPAGSGHADTAAHPDGG